MSTDVLNPAFRSTVDRMMHLMRHRGPDDSGKFNDSFASLGHLRLSIIDLSPSGHQPMVSEDGKKALIFNGEIYNYLELREQFENKLHFRFQNDSEVILKLYENFGVDCLQYLRGMFSLAIWDSEIKQLFFARDRVGKKPFYHTFQKGRFVFASELRCLRAVEDLDFEIDEESIFHYLSLQYIPSPRTIYRNVYKLPPAHFGIFRDGNVSIHRYWNLSYDDPENLNETEALERFEDQFRESVRLRMIADVPVGAFLSGGLDSSAVVSAMSALSAGAVKTFTIRFEEEAYNEAAFAREVAVRCGTEHLEFTVKPDSAEILPRLAWHYSEPYADSSSIAVYYLSQMTSQYVKTALNGDGGDELFGGYDRYQFQSPIGNPSLAPALASAVRSIPINLRYVWRIRKFLEERTFPLPAIYFQKICFFSEEEKRELFSPDFLSKTETLSTLSWYEEWFQRFSSVQFPQNLMAVDIETYLPDDLLVKVDIASMACSLEVRSPFLDHKLLEFAAVLPAKLKIRNGVSKYLLKRYLRDRIPEHLIRRRKQGFGVPIKLWFRGELRDFMKDILLSSSSLQRGYFKRSGLEKLMDRHVSGLFDNTHKLYALLMLELWHRAFVDSTEWIHATTGRA